MNPNCIKWGLGGSDYEDKFDDITITIA